MTKLESLEDEVAKISAEFASHVEAQTRAMENEKMRQHQNIAERRRRALERRRKHGEINSKKYNDSGNMKKNMDHSSMESKTAQLSVMVEEINKSLDMAKQRMVMGRPWEDQLHALNADIKQSAAHQNTVINNGPSRINAPAISVDRPRLSLNQSSSTMAMKRNKEI